MPSGVYIRKKRHPLNENSCHWIGDKVGYRGIHQWISRNFGKANKCENKKCNFNNPHHFEWANISGEYKRERNDWEMLCPSCHRKKDYGDYCKNGHPLFGENVYIQNRNNGSIRRVCRICKYQCYLNNKKEK